MDLEKKFKEETGFDAYIDNNLEPRIPLGYYVEWLEEQCTINGVVKSLPTDDEIYSEASKYARLIKNPHNMTNIKLRQAYKNGAKLILNALKTTK
jgi:hypothetical protein